ncbi:MAG TPA: hypothetical protein VFI61_03070 [Patescibacteria group bacterium]|nr:hypothetical protein [Patescibacteria group bacterium]
MKNVRFFLKELVGKVWSRIRLFVQSFGCLVWVLVCVGIASLAGGWVNTHLVALNWFPDNGLWQISIWTIALVCAFIAFCIECVITLIVMILADKNSDNPGPFPLKPLDKRSGP